MRTLHKNVNQFDKELFESKVLTDSGILFFLRDKFLSDQRLKDSFNTLYEDTVITVGKLLQEANITPRSEFYKPKVLSTVLKEKTRNEILEEQKSNLSSYLTENFVLKINNKDEETLEESAIIITKRLSSEQDGPELNDTEIQSSAGYEIFKNVLGDKIKNIMLPKDSETEISKFVETQRPEYTEIPDNATELLAKIACNTSKIASMLSIFMFKHSADEAGVPFKAEENV